MSRAKGNKPRLAIHEGPLKYEDMVNRARLKAPDVFTMLEDIVADPDASNRDRIAAGSQLLDRAYGKAGQKVEVTGAEGGPVEHAFTVTFVRPGGSE